MASLPKTLILAIALVVPLFTKLSLTSFVSIDCGSSETITDPQTNITWKGDDDGYIQDGQSHNVSSGSGTFSTLRAFPTWKKNKKHCYSIEVQKGEKVLTRASFFYGNYDNMSSPPTFDLIFDGNYWANVSTSMSNNVVDYEAIYVTKGNYTNICVAQAEPSQTPFISSIELRSLNPSMYNHVDPNHALILLNRRAFGSNQDLRYPDDVFDRIWRSKESGSEFIYAVKSEALDINTTTAEDQPPKAAMQNAFTAPNTSCQIEYDVSSLVAPTSYDNNNNVSLYINTFFSEVMKDAIGRRSIQIHNNMSFSSTPILPPFGSVQQVYINMVISSDINSSLYFQSTPSSALPLILNAAEIYRIDPLADGTDTRDVEGLRELQLAFKTLTEWNGDPCLPFPYSWDWIKCTTDSKPRVKALYLGGYNLHGLLPDFRSMDALEIIDLHNNSIEGPIPEFLGFLPFLRVLNLSYNSFTGSMPASLNNTDIDIDLRNNTYVPQMHFQEAISSDAPKMSLKLCILLLVATQILVPMLWMKFQ